MAGSTDTPDGYRNHLNQTPKSPTLYPYGSWPSPITADRVASGGIVLGQTAIEGFDLYWLEGRPAEQGRVVLVHQRIEPREGGTGSGAPVTPIPAGDLTPHPYNVRTRVHEYGGGAFALRGGTVVFSNFADQRLYRSDPGHAPHPITPERRWRFADGVIDPVGECLICVREDHEGAEPVNALVSVDLQGRRDPIVLEEGHDFFAAPRLSPGRLELAWLCWDHPNMPWDGCELWIARIEPDGSLGDRRRVAGGTAESIVQPEWSPDGHLYFVSDRSGWWNLYRLGRKPAAATEMVQPLRSNLGIDGSAAVPDEWSGKGLPFVDSVEALFPAEAEFARPAWVFGQSSYAFDTPGRIVCAYSEDGLYRLASLELPAVGGGPGRLSGFDLPFTDIQQLRTSGRRAILLAGSPDQPLSVVTLDLGTGTHEILRSAISSAVDRRFLSHAEAIRFPAGERTAHGFFYAPLHPDCTAAAQEKPPLLVLSHGGPTSAATTALSLFIQYWTSRGIAVLDVNYGGSTGWGRAYRKSLEGRWGVLDVEDCVAGAQALVSGGKVDGKRLMIAGGSAGGYTTLCALTFHQVFAAGASYYGVSDPAALARETHKFESRYLDRLIGPYPGRADLYRERSPLAHADRLSTPIIFFQGLEDPVVPPAQAEALVEVLRRKKVPVAYLAFEGEQHGFRQAEHIRRALEAELYFFGRILAFAPADAIEPVHIDNLE